jgi:RNA polymerase sigma-70 factor (ECF subfamily)
MAIRGGGLAADAEDAALIRTIRTDPEVFGLLYDRYAARVYRYLRGRVGNSEDAADLTHQVFLRVLVGLEGYRGDASFSGWLFRIARNAATDAERRERESVSWDSIPEAMHPLGGEDPENASLRWESFVQLREMLTQLEPEERELIHLRFWAGLSFSEIGAVVGKKDKTVQKRLARTLRALRGRYVE